jgi:hypothetical protein
MTKRSNVASTTSPPSGISGIPFITMNADAKRLRLAKDSIRWVNEGGPLKKDLVESLHSQMEPHASPELIAHLFSHDHNAVNDFIVGLSMMADFYSNASGVENTEAVGLANVDLPLKYVSIRVHESQSNLVSKCLDVVDTVTDFLRSTNCQITDGEALCFVPTLVHKVKFRSSSSCYALLTARHCSLVMPGSLFAFVCSEFFKCFRRYFHIAESSKFFWIKDLKPKWLRHDKGRSTNWPIYLKNLE